MKQRLFSAGAGLLLLFAVLMGIESQWVTGIVFVGVGLMGLFEAARAFLPSRFAIPWALSALFFLWVLLRDPPFGFASALLLFLFAQIAIVRADRLFFGKMASLFAVTLLLTVSITSLRDLLGFSALAADQRALLLFALSLGWINDTVAFFAGRAFGKRKLAPAISPKKTVEGAIGGLLGTALFAALFAWGYLSLCPPTSLFAGWKDTFSPFLFALIGLVGAAVGMAGDLLFSMIKRSENIKDFGAVMPGHGGVLDRMDSVFLTSIYVCALLSFALNVW